MASPVRPPAHRSPCWEKLLPCADWAGGHGWEGELGTGRGDLGRPAALGYVPSGSSDHACLRVCVCGWAYLGACTCTSEGPKSRSCLAGCGVTWPAQEPSPAPGHRKVQRSLPALGPQRAHPSPALHGSLCPCFRSLRGPTDGWRDGWMENQAFLPSFLPQSTHGVRAGVRAPRSGH